MADLLTAQDVWKMFEETNRKFNETDRQFKETDRKFQETDRQFKETDRKFQETDRQFKEGALRLQETERLLKESFRETEQYLKDLAREAHLKTQETERVLKEAQKKTDKQIGDLGNRLGEYIEEMIKPAAVRMFQSRGIAVHEVHSNVTSKRGDLAMEIDLLVVNDTDLVVIECKSKLTKEHIDTNLERLAKVKILLPHYADMHIYGAVAGMVISEEVLDYAAQKGLFVIGQNGETVDIQNKENFVPALF